MINEIELGKTYYFMVHAYHHFLGKVVAITGKHSCIITNVVRVQSCRRNWTEFFRDGCGDDTTYTIWPDNMSIAGWFAAPPWRHAIPRK